MIDSGGGELDKDRIRLEMIRSAGPDSPQAITFIEGLLAYGIGTLLNLSIKDTLSAKLRQLVPQICLAPTPSGWTEDNLRNVVVSAVESVALVFVDDLLDGAWQPERGATIRTYFVNSCCLAFVNEYRKELNRINRSGGGPESSVGDAADLDIYVMSWLYSCEPDTEYTAVAREQIRELLAHAKHRDIPEIVFLLAQGYRQREIAEHLGRTEFWVSRALANFRQTAREWRSKWS